MKEDLFEKLVNETLEKIKETLIIKGKEYRRNKNPFHNFDVGSKRTGLIREKVLDGFLLKHEISIQDMVNDLSLGLTPNLESVNEKFGDLLIYNIIKKISIIDKINNNNKDYIK